MHFVGLTDRTAVCGPACTVVWQGRVGDHSPYADAERILRTIVFNTFVQNRVENGHAILLTLSTRDGSAFCTGESAGTFVVASPMRSL
jgi:hypothetical protein